MDIQGAGTDDRTLIRIIITRCEVDMKQIKLEFQKRYGQALEAFVRVNNHGFVHCSIDIALSTVIFKIKLGT